MPSDDDIIGKMSKEAFEAWVEKHRRHNDELLSLDKTHPDYPENRAETQRRQGEELRALLGEEGAKQQAAAEALRQQEAGAAAARSQEDVARSQFAAQFAADQQSGVAEAMRDEQDQAKSRFVAEDTQRQAETAKDTQAQSEQARQREAADTLQAELERGRSAAEAADALGRSGVKPTFEQHVKADTDMFEKRREELHQSMEQEKEREIEATVGGIDDPEMAAYVEEERQRIAEKWAQLEAERRAAIALEEQARLDRTRALYGRDD